MKLIGQYKNNLVYYFDLTSENMKELPKENWIIIAIANNDYNAMLFDNIVKYSMSNNLLEFKAQGQHGKNMHDEFDEKIVVLEVIENYPETEIMTKWYGRTTNDLGNAFWDWCNTPIVPIGIDNLSTKIVCISIDGNDYYKMINDIIKDLSDGWEPSIE